jgi:hypothetical protein
MFFSFFSLPNERVAGGGRGRYKEHNELGVKDQ